MIPIKGVDGVVLVVVRFVVVVDVVLAVVTPPCCSARVFPRRIQDAMLLDGRAMARLLAQVEGEEASATREVLDVHLVERQSSGPAPEKPR